ncbi:MAG: ABC transporter ATP-binding protein [Spirochaetes bacterium]|nr:ABC transporter ATP-binding protein [Spirochaetota bacterium]
MLKRFIKYYGPHKKLFFMDMSIAVTASIATIFFPYLTRILLKTHIPRKDIRMIIVFLSLIALIYVITAFLSFIRIKWGHILGTRMEYDMRNDLFRHIQKLSFSYFDSTKTGHLMSRISHDLNMITEVAHHAPEDLIISTVILTGAFFFMFRFNSQLAAIALIPLPAMIFWGSFIGSKIKDTFRTVRRKIADINATVENSVMGIREVKAYTNEELEITKFQETNDNLKKSKEDVFNLMGMFFSVMDLLRNFYYLTIIAAGVYFIYNGRIDTADLLSFLLYVAVILPPIDRLINFIEQYYEGTASFERFIEIMDIEPDITDRKNAYVFSPVKGLVSFNHVSFKYESSHGNVLDNISFDIEAGKTIAFVGESGAGKSTVVSLIPRFYEPLKGTIQIDGHDISGLKQKFLRDNIGIVQQNVFLFDSTIKENILYGNPNATDEQVQKAVRLANIESFIKSLPDGLDTPVGERGVKLSGGQKQRISIARVFLKNPPILIFDEATSSLDTESEKLIQQSMKTLSKNRTTIIIAHRLSTVRHAHRLFVMKKGKIIESGTHSELLKRNSYYSKLYSFSLF